MELPQERRGSAAAHSSAGTAIIADLTAASFFAPLSGASQDMESSRLLAAAAGRSQDKTEFKSSHAPWVWL